VSDEELTERKAPLRISSNTTNKYLRKFENSKRKYNTCQNRERLKNKK